ncbi:BrnT family toxin [Phormidesmis sp. 146-35]
MSSSYPQGVAPDPDSKTWLNESRFLILGYSTGQRLLLVVHCDRDSNIRIISARPATPSERQNYERGT